MSDAAPGARRVLSVATGTLASRITGLLRILTLAYVFGFSPLADSFNLANTVPNMLFDLVLGGIASATFIPVFVERLTHDGERRAWRSISTVVSAAIIVLTVASALAWLLAPSIINGFTALGHLSSHATSALATQRGTATTLLRWFVPQILGYGLLSIAAALLNVRHRFGAPAYAPIANNVICIAVLIWFHLVDPNPGVTLSASRLAFLGAGTTAGVLVQFLVLVPSLVRADLWRLTPRLDLRDPALRSVGRLGSWTLLVVLANQIALYVVLALAFGVGGDGPISSYTYGWAFMQMPYAVVVVSVLNVMTPQLAGLASSRDLRAFGERLGLGLRQSLLVIIPVAAVMLILAQPIVAVLLHHGDGTHTLGAGTVLAVLAAGLPGFTIFQVAIRGLQSMQRARATFILYAFQNAATIGIAWLIGRHSLGGLTASVAIAYGAAALVAVITLARRRVVLWPALLDARIRRSLLAAGASAVAMAISYNLEGWTRGTGLIARLVVAATLGLVVYGACMGALHRRSRARHHRRAH